MNSNDTRSRTGAQLIVEQLAINGVKRIWDVPGESFLAVLDALIDEPSIEIITCRQEGGAGYMAEAEGKLTGEPGICFVTRGPGLSNATIAIHTAAQDSTPCIFFVGGIARDHRNREAFQEFDVREVFHSVARWTENIDNAARIPEIMHRAFAEAKNGRGGPVVIGIPEDMLNDVVENPPVAAAHTRFRTVPGAPEVQAVQEVLVAAERPLLVIGGSAWSEASRAQLQAIAAAYGVPVAVSFRRQDRFDNTHPNYIGYLGVGADPVTVRALKEADAVFFIGSRITDPETEGYTYMEVPTPKQQLVHVHPDHRVIGQTYIPTIAVHAGAQEFIAALDALDAPAMSAARRAYINEKSEAWNGVRTEAPPAVTEGFIEMSRAIKDISAQLPDDAIVAFGAGNFTGWVQRFHEWRMFASQLGPTNGAMGYGVPATVAASIVHRDRVVVGFSGDGDFMMTAQELATVMQYDAKPIFVVIDNGMYGTIRMHQEREHPARVSGTRLTNPDFAKFAESFGLQGENVTRNEDVAAAFKRAKDSGRAALIALRTEPNQITARMTIEKMRARK